MTITPHQQCSSFWLSSKCRNLLFLSPCLVEITPHFVFFFSLLFLFGNFQANNHSALSRTWHIYKYNFFFLSLSPIGINFSCATCTGTPWQSQWQDRVTFPPCNFNKRAIFYLFYCSFMCHDDTLLPSIRPDALLQGSDGFCLLVCCCFFNH